MFLGCAFRPHPSSPSGAAQLNIAGRPAVLLLTAPLGVPVYFWEGPMPVTDQGYREARAAAKAAWRSIDAACGICGQGGIDWDGPKNEPESFELDHIKSRKRFPELAMVPSNWQPSHCRCNRAKSASEAVAFGIGATSEAW